MVPIRFNKKFNDDLLFGSNEYYKQNLLYLNHFKFCFYWKLFLHMSGQCSAIYKLFIASLKIKILWTKNLPGDKQSLRALDYIKIYLPERKKKRKKLI